MSSAERIRERFLSKIGINSQSIDDKTSNQVQTSNTSCLGQVATYSEPLKVCLDDDSSFDEDEFDDEDFFIGEEELQNAMCIDTFKYNQAYASLATNVDTSDNSNDSSKMIHEQNKSIVNDPTSTITPFESLGNNHMMRSTSAPSFSSHVSIGNLTYVSNDSSSLDNSFTKKSKSKRKVSLHEDVTVVPIPMRDEYSKRIKERLWSNSEELHNNAARNSIEFAAEGWDWRKVTEDESMIVCQESGEMIHPIHLYNFMQQQQRCNQTSNDK